MEAWLESSLPVTYLGDLIAVLFPTFGSSEIQTSCWAPVRVYVVFVLYWQEVSLMWTQNVILYDACPGRNIVAVVESVL